MIETNLHWFLSHFATELYYAFVEPLVKPALITVLYLAPLDCVSRIYDMFFPELVKVEGER
jgi:hypothetical protein